MKNQYRDPPAGWIPPQFRKRIYAPLSEEEIVLGMSTMKISDGNGFIRDVTREEFMEAIGGHKVIAVVDSRYQ